MNLGCNKKNFYLNLEFLRIFLEVRDAFVQSLIHKSKVKSFVNFGKNYRVNISCIKLAASLPILIRVEMEDR